MPKSQTWPNATEFPWQQQRIKQAAGLLSRVAQGTRNFVGSAARARELSRQVRSASPAVQAAAAQDAARARAGVPTTPLSLRSLSRPAPANPLAEAAGKYRVQQRLLDQVPTGPRIVGENIDGVAKAGIGLGAAASIGAKAIGQTTNNGGTQTVATPRE